MAIVLDGKRIARIKIIDDNAHARKALAFSVADANCEPIEEPGPIRNLDEFIRQSINVADAVLCDHRLTTYARFSGAEAVASFYKVRFPAVLCTAYSRADIDAMRRYRRHIPAVIGANDVSPEAIVDGFKRCVQEFNGEYLPSRRPWRTLVSVVEVDKESADNKLFVIISAWNSAEVVRLLFDLVPPELRLHIQVGARFYAQVNIGAEDQNDLYFDQFEI